MDNIYFAPHDGAIIAITHGANHYNDTTVYTQEHADALNQRQDITPAQAKAAIACSMFDCWQNFDTLSAAMPES